MDTLIAGGLGLATGQPVALSPSSLPAAVRDHLGHQLQAAYGALIAVQPPQRLLDLIAQLYSALSTHDQESAASFRHGLIEAVPGLQAFAMSLVANEVRTGDLVQETLLKVWAKQATFVPGTNLKAWLCTILRNHFYSEIRKYKREIEDADGAMALQLQAPASQEHGSDLQVVMVCVGGEILSLP
ncbi:sigma factor [Methylorubrum extorquens]|uniref:RNA polymerase subunit sigma-70 n=1 Tax=Methylorubrum extorquens TaxID=408 RepID=A0AAX3WJK4_METEX|nr:sigma factor [Methylorubrum extorquens]ABY28559.1 sigma-70 region 2 domain protein [Methylorubrum extorquens PA1]KQP93096.1 hypothetical protein ASF55_20600 [Methylobacterium sp. Leaf119]WHQ70184.1 RNA polymerase subunit sigma-70 [Methylorubrum extorquens]WIU39943.1 RNA polymerase subunit sigma-70 [Methylorubrum extorquens]